MNALRLAGRACIALVLLLGAFLGAALVGAIVPRNAGWVEARNGVTVWLGTNGVHTDLTLPVRAAGIDLDTIFPTSDLGRTDIAPTHLAFGWGERRFYLSTPTWDDFTLWAGVRALVLGRDTLLHVDHLGPPARGPRWRPIVLSEAQYRRLAAFIVATRRGEARPVRGFGPYDLFYPARGRYTPWRTCNSWVGDALAAAGVRVGLWTPFAGGVFWRFSEKGEAA